MSLLLALVQHGAVLHELGHLSHGERASVPSLQADPQDSDADCPTCQAFAQVTNPASGTAGILPAPSAVYLPVAAPIYAVIAAETLTPRSRGPPRA